ncbi:MAG: response regulator [Chloroflexota bacterium]
MTNLEPENFELQLRDCLTHYYDYAFLQRHPLVQLLAANTSGEARQVQSFRELIEQAIESLRPGPDSDPASKQARLYNILFFRYINQQQVQQVLHRLNLGERQFYRDHNKAVQALSDVLWGRVQGTVLTPIPISSPKPDSSISIQSEIQRIHNQARPEQVNAKLFLQKALTSIQSLVEQYRAEISLQVNQDALLPANDIAVLRQAIIWILSRLIIEAPPCSHFSLSFQNHEVEGEFGFCAPEHPDPAQLIEQETPQNLVQAMEGRVETHTVAGERGQIGLFVPLHKRSVLIIDDNPDVIALFRHYLAGSAYQILTADEGEPALQLARDSSPDLIVLDVLLPQQDGWEILQQLKSHISTRDIPVLICSVLDSPELAHVLGADGFLRKPPGESEFLAVLSHFARVN